MNTAQQSTCGQGLAENSVFPAKLGNVIAGMAENLALHMRALDLDDPAAKAEYDAYERLVRQLERSAVELQATAAEMAGYRDLPMGRHDEAVMAQPEVRQAFENFVSNKRELLSLLEQTAERDEQLLKMMRSPGRS